MISDIFQYVIVPFVAVFSFVYCSVRACREWRTNRDRAILLICGASISFFIGLFFWPGDVVEWVLVDVIVANLGYSILIAIMIATPIIYRWWRS
jgi:hypothetical protein